MTEPVRPLEALEAQWRTEVSRLRGLDSSGDYVDGKADGLEECADALAALLQAAAPPALTAEPTHHGTWPEHCEQRAFVEGAKWQIWKEHGATPWGRERRDAEEEAVRLYGDPLSAAPPAPTAEKCPTCGAPTLKPGERHAKVLPPRIAPPFYLEPDEDSIPAAPPERVSEGKE